MTASNQTYPNELLRAHVTRVGFDLSLGWTHIEALVRVAEAHRTKRDPAVNMRFWIGAVRGCIDRGLVIHKWDGGGKPLHHYYSLTKAGKFVVALLEESGLYEEYAGAKVRELKSA